MVLFKYFLQVAVVEVVVVMMTLHQVEVVVQVVIK